MFRGIDVWLTKHRAWGASIFTGSMAIVLFSVPALPALYGYGWLSVAMLVFWLLFYWLLGLK